MKQWIINDKIIIVNKKLHLITPNDINNAIFNYTYMLLNLTRAIHIDIYINLQKYLLIFICD